MSYSRPCGVHTVDCAASACRCVSVDGEPVNEPEEPVCEFPCCGHHHCCTHDNPMQTTYEGSRADA